MANAAVPAPARRNSQIDWSPIFGYDVFVSYNRADSHSYAQRLETELRAQDLRCFLDNADAPPGTALTSTLQTSLKRSRTLVLLVSRGALRSHWVAEEVRTFAKCGRDIIPINLDGSVHDSDPGNPILSILRQRDSIWIDDVGPVGVPAVPNTAAVDGIRRTFRYRRANKLRRMVTALAFVTLLVITIVALYQWRKSRAQLVQLQGRQLLIQAEALQREQPGEVEPVALLAMESQLRAPSAEATDLMRQSLTLMAPAPTSRIPVKEGKWLVAADGASMRIVSKDRVQALKLPSGDGGAVLNLPEPLEAQTVAPPAEDDTQQRIGPRLMRDDTPLLSFSPDGTAAAAWNSRKELVLWDLATGKVRWRRSHPQGVEMVQVADAGRAMLVVTNPESGAATVSNMVEFFRCDGSSCAVEAWPAADAPRQAMMLTAAVSRDAKRIAVMFRVPPGGRCCDYFLQTFDTGNLSKPVLDISTDGQSAAAAFSPNLDSIAILLNANLYLVANGKQIHVRLSQNAEQVRFSESGRTFVTTGKDGLRIWDVARIASTAAAGKDSFGTPMYFTGAAPLAHLTQATQERFLSLRDDGAAEGCTVLTANASNVTTLWNCSSGQALLKATHSQAVTNSIRVGGQILTQSGQELQIRPIDANLLRFDHQGRTLALSDFSRGYDSPQVPVKISPDGKRAVVCVHDGLWLWDLVDGRLLARTRPDEAYGSENYQSCEFAGGGQYVIVLKRFAMAKMDHTFSALDTQNGHELRDVANLSGGLFTPQWAVSPALPYLYIAGSKGALHAFDLRVGKNPVLEFGRGPLPADAAIPVEEDSGQSLLVSGDGERIVALDGDTVRVWNARDPAKPVLKQVKLQYKATRLRITRDHRRIGLIAGDKALVIMDTDSAAERKRFDVQGKFDDFQFDDSGNFVAVNPTTGPRVFAIDGGAEAATTNSAANTERVLGYFTGRQFIAMKGSSLVGIDIASGKQAWARMVNPETHFTLMGDKVALVEKDRSIGLYPIGEGPRIALLARQREPSELRGLGDDQLLFWGGSLMQRYRWLADPGKLLAGRLSRPFTESEWNQYLPGESYRNTLTAYGATTGSWWRRWWPFSTVATDLPANAGALAQSVIIAPRP